MTTNQQIAQILGRIKNIESALISYINTTMTLEQQEKWKDKMKAYNDDMKKDEVDLERNMEDDEDEDLEEGGKNI